MELIKVGEKTYYIANRTNIGIYKVNETDVYLIDTGNDKDAGKKILRIIEEQGWKVVGIINTHAHADHIGGNKVIQERTGCKVYAYEREASFAKYTDLESSFLYGGCPPSSVQNKFFYASCSNVEKEFSLPEGLEMISLPGHFFDMIGIRTSDDVLFLGDALIDPETISKYHIFYLYDVPRYEKMLNELEDTSAKLFIPSHGIPLKEIHKLIQIHQEKMEEICDVILKICETPCPFDTLLKQVFDFYHLDMDQNQFLIVGSTIKSYLSSLKEKGQIDFSFEENQMIWKSVKK